MEETRFVDYPMEGIGLGQGWDSETGNKKDVIGIVFIDPQDDLGQKKNMFLEKVSDRHSLMESLGISAEFQYKGVIGGVEAKADFARNVETSSIFESFVAQAKVENALKYAAPAPEEYAHRIALLIDKKKPLEEVKASLNLDVQDYRRKFNLKPLLSGKKGASPKGTRSVRLTPDALEMVKASPDEFRRVYGDCYVHAITLGAELIAMMTFREFDKKERQKIETSIEGSGWGARGKAGFQNTLDRYSKDNKITIKYYQSGGKGDPIPTDVEGFLKKIEELPKLAAEHPVPFQIMLKRYHSLPNWPKGSKPASTTSYEALLRRYLEYDTLYNDINTVLKNKDYLLGRGVDKHSLKIMQDELLTGMKAIFEALKKVGEKGATYEMPESAQKPDYEFRIGMPIPWDYDKSISFDMHEDDLRELLSEYWIEDKSKKCCKRRPDDPGCLKNKEIDSYKRRIPCIPRLKLGFCRLFNRHSSKYLAVGGGDRGNKNDGAKVIIWENTEQKDIEWFLEPQEEKGKSMYKIRNHNSDKYLAVPNGAKNKGAKIIQYRDVGQADILWELKRQEPDTTLPHHVGRSRYKIRNVNSKLYLVVASAAKKNGAEVIQWPDVGQPDIIWCLDYLEE